MSDLNALNPKGLRWKDLIGKRVLIGLTFVNKTGNVLEQRQLHGRIASAVEGSGITVDLDGNKAGESYSLPPDLRSVISAKPGEYTLRATGEVLINPDFLANFTITRASDV
jgi:hypothetical protein